MDELLEILNDIQPGVDFENETHLIDNHLLDSLSIALYKLWNIITTMDLLILN